MEEPTKYLPRHKSDFQSVVVLKEWDKPNIILLIPQLLEWIQDINWPIAKDIAALLLRYPEATIPHVKAVLISDDDIWKENSLRYFVKDLPDELIAEFRSDLERISSSPTRGEVFEEVNETARIILESIE